jgi:Tfp pilus assembly pilus retraction ATPase PilT
MYSMDDLLQLVYSERADGLRLHVGLPVVIVVRGDHHSIDGPSITPENAEQLLQSISDTRQRRELGERGVVQFIYRRGFPKRNRKLTEFVVCARMENAQVGIDIQVPPRI